MKVQPLATRVYEDYWNKLQDSAKYHPANRYRYHLMTELLAKVLKPGMTVLDMGCGDARLVTHLRELWPECQFFACDISERVVEANQRREPKVSFFQADVSASDFCTKAKEMGASSVDVVVSSEVIEHVENDDALIANALALLNEDGHFILTTQSGPRYRVDFELLHHLRHYKKNELAQRLQGAGFLLRHSYACGFPVLTLQKIVANFAFDSVMKAAANTSEPKLWVRWIMATMFFAMKWSPRWGGPQLVMHATRPRKRP